MKLFTKYSRINVAATIIIFLIASTAFYLALNYVLLQQIDNDLQIEQDEITTYVQKHNQLPENIPVKDQLINYTITNAPLKGRHLETNTIVDRQDKDGEEFRQIIFCIKAAGKWYKVTVSKSLEDTDKLIHSILLISFTTILTILIATFIINRVVLKKIWRPFYQSLAAVKNFNLSKNQNLHFPPVQVEEFRFMNETLERITSQAQLEYLSLKTFSENASHEIQTPIAIIRSKLDLLIQDEQLTEQQSQVLQTVYAAIQKLTKLNQSLLLLAKIENNQYEEVQQIEIKEKIEEKAEEFRELWQAQEIIFDSSLKGARINMNKELADILLNNLFSNATKHNFKGGTISVDVSSHHLRISNTSQAPSLDENKLFQRFYKPSAGDSQNGLGLSIIKQICDVSGFQIDYTFKDSMHVFSVSWL
jgi:signal transduction histidine kinase